MIEKSGKKVTVMTGRPNDFPTLKTHPVKPHSVPTVNATKGPSYNDAFANFLLGKSNVPTEESASSAPKNNQTTQQTVRIVSKATVQTNPLNRVVLTASIPAKVIQVIQQPVTAPKVHVQQNFQRAQVSRPQPKSETEVQQKQEMWTQKVLKQTQQKPPPSPQEKVKTERIQPYVTGQSQLFSVQPIVSNSQPVLYGIVNSNNATKSSQQKKQQSC